MEIYVKYQRFFSFCGTFGDEFLLTNSYGRCFYGRSPACSTIVLFCLIRPSMPLVTAVPGFRLSAPFLSERACARPSMAAYDQRKSPLLSRASMRLLLFGKEEIKKTPCVKQPGISFRVHHMPLLWCMGAAEGKCCCKKNVRGRGRKGWIGMTRLCILLLP